MKALSTQELHYLAMNIVGRQLESDGYEFMAVNSKLKKNPQFVCLKNKQLHFIVVRPITYPDDPSVLDIALMETIKSHAIKHEALTFYAGVGLTNAEDISLPVYLDEPYLVDYEGLVEV
jgi:hypothetical protein